MSKVILEIDGERHLLTASANPDSCMSCSLSEKCTNWGGAPCDMFDVEGVFEKQEIPEDILPLLLILHEAVKKMRRLQQVANPVQADVNMRIRAEREVDSVLQRIQDYWDAELA